LCSDCMLHLSKPTSYRYPNKIWCEVQIVKGLTVQCFSSPYSCSAHSFSLIKIPRQQPADSSVSYLNLRDQVSHPFNLVSKIAVLCILVFIWTIDSAENKPSNWYDLVIFFHVCNWFLSAKLFAKNTIFSCNPVQNIVLCILWGGIV
jgi:hypothetical protein